MNMSKLDCNMAVEESDNDLLWYDASALTLQGKGWQDTTALYHRLPAETEQTDLGYQRFADALEGPLQKILGCQ